MKTQQTEFKIIYGKKINIDVGTRSSSVLLL